MRKGGERGRWDCLLIYMNFMKERVVSASHIVGYYHDDVGGRYSPISSFPQSSPLYMRPLPARQQPCPALPALYVSGHVVTDTQLYE